MLYLKYKKRNWDLKNKEQNRNGLLKEESRAYKKNKQQ